MKKIFISLVTAVFVAFGVNAHAAEVDVLGGVDIHGFVSQGYIQSQDNNYLANNSSDGTFAFNEIGINFGKQLTDQLRIGLQLFSHDLGAIGNNKITLDWAYADYRWKDWLGLRVGKIKSPHGLYNESRDMDMLRTNIFLPQSVYAENNRDTMAALQGIGVYGDVPIGAGGGLSYYVLAGTMDISGDNDVGPVRQFNGQEGFEVTGDFEVDHVYVGSLEWRTPLDGLLFKTTYRTLALDIPTTVAGTYDSTYIMNEWIAVVYSVEYTWNDLVLAAEYTTERNDYEIDIPAFGGTYEEATTDGYGYYVSAAYRVNDWFEVGTYYSMYYPNSDDKDGDESVASGRYMYDYQAWQEDYALSLRFDVNEYWVAKLEGHLVNGAAQCMLIDNDDFRENWY